MKLRIMSVILSGLLLTGACGNSQTNNTEKNGNSSIPDKTEEVTVNNPTGAKVIADLSGSTEELLLIGRLPAASANADFGNPGLFSPPIKDKLPESTVNLGWYGEPINVETVAAVQPDLIILGSLFNEELYEQLSQLGPTIRIPHPYYKWRERLTFLADLFDEQDKAAQWLSDYDNKTEEWRNKLQPIIKDETFAVVETYPSNLVIYSSSGIAEMIFDELQLLPSPGIPQPEHWGGLEVSLESLTEINPDHLILLENSENKMEDSKVWNNLAAVKKGNVYKITNIDNYNYSFTSMGRMEMLDRIGTLIMEKQK